jgi:hypothetical protein
MLAPASPVKNKMNQNVPHDLTREEAGGMTVNERLWVSGRMDAFDEAVTRKDIETMTEILQAVHIGKENIEAIIRNAIDKK